MRLVPIHHGPTTAVPYIDHGAVHGQQDQSRRGMITRLRETFSLSLEAQVYYHYGYTSSEHDAVLLAWKEKVAHNLVRPTTTVQASQAELVLFPRPHAARKAFFPQDTHVMLTLFFITIVCIAC